ncbi:major facilitator superfamily domain-containing protein [Peziza echinospora]|nr:major facilitator superfamily domain-containing protein [Peziza echinospora]
MHPARLHNCASRNGIAVACGSFAHVTPPSSGTSIVLADDVHAVPSTIDEKALLRKIDMRLLPVLCVLYLLAFLDRVNISNAAIFGLKEDLKLDGIKYNTALTIFFVPYIICEIPSNMLLKKFKPHVWLSGCMFLFGLVTTMQGLVQNYGGILTTRFFLGVFEAGMFPGCFYLIAMWYRRDEAQKRYTFFFNSTSLAGAFGGLLASGIGKMDYMQGYRGWRWIFILEGILTCLCSIAFFFLIQDFPEEAKFLTEEERAFVKDRLQRDVGTSARDETMTWRDILEVFKDYKIMLGGLMYLGMLVPAYGYAYFAPSIVKSFGYGAIETQLRSVPPWVASFVYAMVIAIFSDKIKHRFLFAFVSILIAMAGLIILLCVHDDRNVKYGALFLVTSGCYGAMPVIVCWFNTNLGGHHRRAVGTAWQIGFGNIGGIIATYTFVAAEAPRYVKGYSLGLGFLGLALMSLTAYFFAIKIENHKRDIGTSKYSNPEILATMSEVEKKKLGDLNPDYRYLI